MEDILVEAELQEISGERWPKGDSRDKSPFRFIPKEMADATNIHGYGSDGNGMQFQAQRVTYYIPGRSPVSEYHMLIEEYHKTGHKEKLTLKIPLSRIEVVPS